MHPHTAYARAREHTAKAAQMNRYQNGIARIRTPSTIATKGKANRGMGISMGKPNRTSSYAAAPNSRDDDGGDASTHEAPLPPRQAGAAGRRNQPTQDGATWPKEKPAYSPPPATWERQCGKHRGIPPQHSLSAIGARLGDHGLIMILFETPSGFAIFYGNGISLYEPGAMEVVWQKDFQIFKDKSNAINLDTGLNDQLSKMLLKWRRPGQKLAVGKHEYRTIIEASLGIPCLCDEPVMEVMLGIRILMHILVPEEKSELANEHRFQISQGLKMLLNRYGFNVDPEMVNVDIMETACALLDCEHCLEKNSLTLRWASEHFEEVSSINSQDWDLLKIATALKMVCYPEEEIVFGNPHEMFSADELSRLVTDAHKYDGRLMKGTCLSLYDEMVFAHEVRSTCKKLLASLVKEAKEAYEHKQAEVRRKP
ncbi:hypothetical protein EJB05_23372, partial [Eragrostis curvula]